MGHGLHAHPLVETVDLVGVLGAVGHHATEPHFVVLGLGLDGGDDPIHGEDRIEIIRRHDQAVVGVLQRRGKAPTHHITEHIKDHHIGVLEQVMLLEQLHRLPGDIATTTGARRRTTGFHTLHAVEAFEHEIFWPQFLGVEVHGFENVDHRGHHLLGEREGAVVLGIATDLKHPLAELGEGGRQIGAGGALADAPFAIHGNHQGAFLNLKTSLLVHLNTALAIGTGKRGGHTNEPRARGWPQPKLEHESISIQSLRWHPCRSWRAKRNSRGLVDGELNTTSLSSNT